MDRKESDNTPGDRVTSDLSYWNIDHSAWGPVHEQPLDRFALATARTLTAAYAVIPSVTHHERADISVLNEFRHTLNAKTNQQENMAFPKLTLLSFFVTALARCLREFPKFNASLNAAGDTLIIKDYIHIGIAVDTEFGLMVPVIRDADKKGVRAIAAEISDLAGRARQRKFRPKEMGGASMTITNLGGIGGIGFTPIINPPELAILGLSRAETVTVWDNGTPRPVPMIPLDMTYDHRVINGADAARFVEHLRAMIADPRKLLI